MAGKECCEDPRNRIAFCVLSVLIIHYLHYRFWGAREVEMRGKQVS